jgi:hypothetical protein
VAARPLTTKISSEGGGKIPLASEISWPQEALVGGMSPLAALLAAENIPADLENRVATGRTLTAWNSRQGIDRCRSSKRKSPTGAGLVRAGLNNEPN